LPRWFIISANIVLALSASSLERSRTIGIRLISREEGSKYFEKRLLEQSEKGTSRKGQSENWRTKRTVRKEQMRGRHRQMGRGCGKSFRPSPLLRTNVPCESEIYQYARLCLWIGTDTTLKPKIFWEGWQNHQKKMIGVLTYGNVARETCRDSLLLAQGHFWPGKVSIEIFLSTIFYPRFLMTGAVLQRAKYAEFSSILTTRAPAFGMTNLKRLGLEEYFIPGTVRIRLRATSRLY
jgi:hypothetical protein